MKSVCFGFKKIGKIIYVLMKSTDFTHQSQFTCFVKFYYICGKKLYKAICGCRKSCASDVKADSVGAEKEFVKKRKELIRPL